MFAVVRPWLGGVVFVALCLSDAGAQEGDIRLNPIQERADQGPRLASLGRSRLAADPRAKSLCEILRDRVREIRARANRLTDAQVAALNRIRSSGNVRLRLRPELGTPRQLKGTRLRNPARILAADVGGLATAWAFLLENRDLLRLDEPQEELFLVRREVDWLGRTHLRFAQVYRDVPIVPADLIVHLDPAGNVDLVSGAYVPTPRNAVIDPGLNQNDAKQRALSLVGGSVEGPPELILFARDVVPPRLAWRVRVRRSLLSEMELVINAADGSILSQRDRVARQNVLGSGTDLLGVVRPLNVWHEAGVHYLVDTSKPMFDPASMPPNNPRGAILIADLMNADSGALAHVTSPNPSAWALPDGVSAAFGLSRVYDYFLDVHGRNSYDDAGSTILGVVRTGTNLMNAHWNPGAKAMLFGDGDLYAASLDVLAHEMTHAVISYSANLEYVGQSGALNESFADVFGELVEAHVLGANDWQIGTELQAPLRDMQDPGSLEIQPGVSYPSKMSQFFNLPLDPDNDHGGVHINSSIVNHCFYLLAEGMPTAIGRADAGAIFYRALTVHLTASSQFKDARLACVASAEELFGQGAAQVDAVVEAFDRVEIGDAPPSEDPFEFPEVGADDATLFIFSDGSQLLLGRRDGNEGDPAIGISLDPDTPVADRRITVRGDGEFGVCVTSDNDVGLIDVYGTNGVTPLGFPGQVHSVAMDPSGERFAFVFLDASGDPTNEITVVDIATNDTETFVLEAATLDGVGSAATVVFADVMDFTADGRFLIYDALNEVALSGGGTEQVWSIYARDLNVDTTLSVVPPIVGLQIGNPALAQTSDSFMTFEVLDNASLDSTIFAGDLNTGELEAIAVVAQALGAPVYSGNDDAILFQEPDGTTTTGFNLVRQPVTNRLMPTGARTTWVPDAGLGAVYRRGAFTVPNAPPDATIDTPVKDVTITEGESVSFAATGSDPNGHLPLTYRWSFGGGAPDAVAEDPGSVRFDATGVFVASLTVTDSEGLADPTPHTRTITVVEPPPPPPPAPAVSGGGGGGLCGTTGPLFLPVLLLVWFYRRRHLGTM